MFFQVKINDTVNVYDAFGRLKETTTNDIKQIENTYNDVNQIIETRDANNNISVYAYDQNGQTTYANEKGFVTEKEYDLDGNVIKETRWEKDYIHL